jgi:hypothetical protein
MNRLVPVNIEETDFLKFFATNFHYDFREPCDNVHVFNAADVGEIVVPCLNYKTRKSLYVTGITGDMVTCALNLENWLQSQMTTLQDEVKEVMNDSTGLDQVIIQRRSPSLSSINVSVLSSRHH